MSKLILIMYVFATSLALILLKLGTTNGAAPIEYVNSRISLNINPQIIGGIFLYGVSFMLYTYLISKNDLGYIIPITAALVYTIIFTASFFIFKESFTPIKITAICMIVLGIILLNFKK